MFRSLVITLITLLTRLLSLSTATHNRLVRFSYRITVDSFVTLGMWLFLLSLPVVGTVYYMHDFASDCHAKGGTISNTYWHSIPDVTTCSYR